MKISTYILALAIFLLSACRNSKSEQNSETSKNDSIKTEETSQVDGNFEEFLSHFEEVKVPFEYRVESFFPEPKYLPENYNKFVGLENSEYPSIIPFIRFSPLENIESVLFVTSNADDFGSLYLCNFKNGTLTSTQTFDFIPDMMMEFQQIVVDEYGNFYENYQSHPRVEFWQYEGYGIAYNMRATGDAEKYESSKGQITHEGKVLEGIPYLDVVQDFLTNLGDGEFEKAFALQENKNWGNFEKFASADAFGGIYAVFADSLSILSKTESKAEIYCNATYKDSINGSAEVSQTFTVSKQNNEWKITDMKVSKYDLKEKYFCNNFYEAEFSMSNISPQMFDFYLFVVSDKPEDTYDQKYAGEIYGEAQFLDENHAIYDNGKCKIDFYFTGKTQVKIVETNCDQHRHENIKFNGIYKVASY